MDWSRHREALKQFGFIWLLILAPALSITGIVMLYGATGMMIVGALLILVLTYGRIYIDPNLMEDELKGDSDDL